MMKSINLTKIPENKQRISGRFVCQRILFFAKNKNRDSTWGCRFSTPPYYSTLSSLQVYLFFFPVSLDLLPSFDLSLLMLCKGGASPLLKGSLKCRSISPNHFPQLICYQDFALMARPVDICFYKLYLFQLIYCYYSSL